MASRMQAIGAMTSLHPVDIETTSPASFDRLQLALRLAIALALAAVGFESGWFGCALYLILPAVAAAMISGNGADGFERDVRPSMLRALGWLIAFVAYMALVTDRFPRAPSSPATRLVVAEVGRPTVGSALLRLLTSLPSALVVSLLGIVGCWLWIVSVVCVLVAERQPGVCLRYQRGLLRWQARLLAYHASLVDAYPPFSFDTGASEPSLPIDRSSVAT
jgi:hypothetical protein